MTRWMFDFARLGVFCTLVLMAAQTVLADHEEGHEEKTYGLRITVEDGEVKVEQTGSENLEGLPEKLSEQIKQAMEQVGDAAGKIRVEAKAMVRDDEGNLKEVPVETIVETLQGELGESLNLDVLKELGMDVAVWVEDDADGNKKQKRVIIKKMHDHGDAHDVMKNVIVKALGDGAAEGEINVNVEMLVDGEHEGHDGKPRKVIIKRMKTTDGGDVELLEKIGGLKTEIRAAQGQPLKWTAKGEDGEDENIFIMEGPWGLQGDVPLPRSTHRLGVAIGGTAGVVVAQVGDDTAASEAGLEAGDIILRANGDTVSDVAALILQVNEAGASDSPMTLTVVRDDEVLEVTAQPRRVEDDDHDHDHADDHDHDHDHADDDDSHADKLREMRDRARAMAEEAQQQARRKIEEARRDVERRAREMQRQAREIERARRDDLEKLRDEVSELREMIRELAEELKQRD